MELLRYLLHGLICVIMLNSCMITKKEDVIQTVVSEKIENKFHLKTLWKSPVGNGASNIYSNLHPVYQNGNVYVADRSGIVKALNATNGKEKWKVDLSEKKHFFSKRKSALLSSGITFNNNCVYIGSERGQIYSLNSSNGNVLWKVDVLGEMISPPIVTDGLVLLHTNNGILQALDQTTGVTKWCVHFNTPLLSVRGESAPVVNFDDIIISDDNGRISSILVRNGELIWQKNISPLMQSSESINLKDADSTPIIVNNIIYVQTYNGNLIAMALNTDKILWQRRIGGVKNLVYNSGMIYTVDSNNKVIALRCKNGEIIWTQSNLSHRSLTSPKLFQKYLVIGDGKGYLDFISIINGKIVSQNKFDNSGFQSEPVIIDNTKLVIQSNNGTVYAINTFK